MGHGDLMNHRRRVGYVRPSFLYIADTGCPMVSKTRVLCSIHRRCANLGYIMKTLLIDDLREIPADLVARTYNTGLFLLMLHRGNISSLLLDHDLGEFEVNKTGYDLIKEARGFLPDMVEIVSANPVGVKNIGFELTSQGYKGDYTGRVWTKV